MATDDDFERGIQALLDGRPLPDAAPNDLERVPLQIIDAIARAHRVAMLGREYAREGPEKALWGHLEIRGEIGRGASGTVYRAWDTRLAREVALKLFSADEGPSDAALEEGRLLARLDHPHIVRVFGSGSFDGVAGVWMELLEGDTLDEIVARDGWFSGEEATCVGLDLARALAAVHGAGLLHRDVKTRNVVREHGGRIVLMDLGAGRLANQTDDRGDTTGTPMYMAPEVLNGGAATVRSDLYSLGIVLFRLLTGVFPVSAADVERLRVAHASGARTALVTSRPDLEPSLIAIVERCCHPDSDRRYDNAIEIETALAESLATTLARRATVASRLARRWQRWRQPVTVAAGIAVLSLATAWGLWDSRWGRDLRRQLGMVVFPQSTLYVTMNGGLGILSEGRFRVFPHNPGTAAAIAVSSDLGVHTMAGQPPYTTGGRFRLDGSPLAPATAMNSGSCCYFDGTTDGRQNFAVRQDSTLLEPFGSRPLAPPALLRFARDWSQPEVVFALNPDSGNYVGVAYSALTQSFWVTKRVQRDSVVEHWSRDGRHLSTPILMPSSTLVGIARDSKDNTLWTINAEQSNGLLRFENFDVSGRHLGTFEVPMGLAPPGVSATGAEFAWNGRH